jgi:hypothetical protein
MKYHAAVLLTVSCAVAYYIHPIFTLSFASRQGGCRAICTKNTRLRILTCNNLQTRLHNVICQTICTTETTSLLQTIVPHSWTTGLPGRSAGQRGEAPIMSSKVPGAATARVLCEITETTRIKDMALLLPIVNCIRSHNLHGIRNMLPWSVSFRNYYKAESPGRECKSFRHYLGSMTCQSIHAFSGASEAKDAINTRVYLHKNEHRWGHSHIHLSWSSTGWSIGLKKSNLIFKETLDPERGR